MTSEEIKLALKPMFDFAPAVLRAAEICQAAEAAEKFLAALEQKKADATESLKTELVQLANRKNLLTSEVIDVGRRLTETLADADRRHKVKIDMIATLDSQISTRQDDLNKLDSEFSAKETQKLSEIAALDMKLKQLRDSFEEFKKSHNL